VKAAYRHSQTAGHFFIGKPDKTRYFIGLSTQDALSSLPDQVSKGPYGLKGKAWLHGANIQNGNGKFALHLFG
jgi:hypothetical protein